VPDEADPPRKNYGFKDREFQRDNPLSSEAAPMPTAKELAMMAGPVAKHGQAAVGKQKQDDPNDVYAVLQGNRAIEQKHGLDSVEIQKIKSRRKRDYWLLMITVESTLAVVAVLGHGNPFVLVGSIAAMGFFGAGITWVMWQIMSKY
jgi:hypothetical protein